MKQKEKAENIFFEGICDGVLCEAAGQSEDEACEVSEALKPRLAHASGAYPGFFNMKRLGVFLLPLDGMLDYRRSLPHNLLGFPNNSPVPIYTPGWRGAL